MTPLLARLGAWFVARRRARYRPKAAPLAAAERAELARFFPPETLDAARVAMVPRIPGPPFARLLARAGLRVADFDRVVGITYRDTIVLAERLHGEVLLATLFHELVHVEQGRQLGARGFLGRYMGEWLHSGRYDGITLERDAYALQRRFEAAPNEPFDVAAEVAAQLAPVAVGATLECKGPGRHNTGSGQ